MWKEPRSDLRKPLHIFFYLLSLLYGGAVRCRNLLFDTGILKQDQIGCPVISVGNITVGGTGKTPMVMLLAGMLKNRGLRPAVLSRGYGGNRTADVIVVSDGTRFLAGPQEAGDEPVLIARRLKDVPVLVGPKRAITGRHAFTHFSPDVILLDDGFQHRYLKRDMDIVLLDGRMPQGNGHLLPRGPLREPLSAVGRAGVIAFTRWEAGFAELTDPEIAGLMPDRLVLHTRIRPVSLVLPGREELPLSFLEGKRVFAFAGIARPDSFRQTIESLGGMVAGFMAFPDHHRYRPEDLDRIENAAGQTRSDVVLCTEKDLVKLSELPKLPSGICGLVIETEILEGREDLEKTLNGIVPMRREQKPGTESPMAK
jgi:tetraacyldisaccharide 4'-kinase